MPPKQSARRRQRIYEGQEAIDYLGAIDLNVEVLLNTVRVGEMQRRGTHPLAPRIAPGFNAWSNQVSYARANLARLGWHPEFVEGLELTVNDRLNIALAFASGDDGVGLRDRVPCTRYPKGPLTERFVEENHTGFLFPEMAADRERLVHMKTYWLLTWSRNGIVRSELSVPLGIDAGYFTSWDDRVILPETSSDGLNAPPDDEPPATFEIHVQPRF